MLLLPACATQLENIRTGIKLDGWHKVHAQDVPGTGNIIEFAKVGETTQSWTELITIQLFEGRRQPPRDVMAQLEQSMRNRVAAVEWSVIDDGPDSLLYEWRFVGDPQHGTQHELARLLRGNDGLHRMAYSRKSPIDAATRALWLERLRAAKVWKDNAPIVLVPAGR